LKLTKYTLLACDQRSTNLHTVRTFKTCCNFLVAWRYCYACLKHGLKCFQLKQFS